MTMFDLHVHSAPDVVARFADDVEMVHRYEEAGFSGCVLKAHHEPTVGRAHAAGRGRRLRVYGGVVLNRAVGGINPAAVAASLAAGGRIVWILTHPSFTVPSMDAASVRALTQVGAFAEVTAYQLLHQDGCSAAALADFIRAVGQERCILSSDAGQPYSPPPPQALRVLVDALVAEDIPRAKAEAMAGSIPYDLVTP